MSFGLHASDPYTAADGLLHGRTLPGSALTWNDHRNLWRIASNKVGPTQGNSVGFPTPVSHASPSANGRASAVVNLGASGLQGGVSARVTDQNSGWHLYLHHGLQAVVLLESTSNVHVVRDSDPLTITQGTDYLLMLYANANRLLGYVNGVLRVEYTSAVHQDVKRFGIFSLDLPANNGVRIDSYQFELEFVRSSRRRTESVRVERTRFRS